MLTLVLWCAAALIAYTFKGFSGFGPALVVVPVLSVLWSPATAEVAGHGHSDDAGRARAVLDRVDAVSAQVIVKRPGAVTVFGRGEARDYGHPVLRSHEIVDATGAGDVFAAGLLAGVARSDLGLGVRLGSAMASRKLRRPAGY